MQGLHRDERLDVLALGLQDTPPGSAAVSLAQRTTRRDHDALDAVRVLSLRGAPHLHRRADLPVLRRELRPRSDAQLAEWAPGHGVTGVEHVDALVELIRSEFPGDTATKGELSAAVGSRAPRELTRWCEGCGAEHVLDGVFRLCTLLAGVELEPAGSRLVFRRPQGPPPPVEPPGEPTLLTAYLRLVGPVTRQDARTWLGAGPRDPWPELRSVVVDERVLLLLHDAGLLPAPDPPRVLLLPPRDPYLLGPRWLVAPDADVARRLWRPVGSPGAVVVDGVVTGTWRSSTTGRTMTVEVDAPRGTTPRRELAAQAELLAHVRGADALEPHVVVV
ncbi:DNA glycosylase AlkZ-like family protein [Umezawaea beigongshangensis]|uniref:DNA glycosylase AlkZ-like family protein n=1 Tax=Umezawaea beigongshangensis TaxID=2780383 RepID=UPI0018F1EC85|nr:crosslink repair DNA glycosylase YcaQ family protein [Umezawaea beigongshangensis]